MLEVSLEWKKVPDLMMEEENILLEDTGPNKQRRDLISQGRRKRRKEDNIWPEKGGHSPTVSWNLWSGKYGVSVIRVTWEGIEDQREH